MGRGDLRARDFSDKIEDSDLRKQVKPFVDLSLIIYLIDKKRSEDALKLIASAELTHFQRVWALTQVARQFAETDRDRALGLLGDALDEAAASVPQMQIDRVTDRRRQLCFSGRRAPGTWLVKQPARQILPVLQREDSGYFAVANPGINSMRTNSTENFDLRYFRSLTKTIIIARGRLGPSRPTRAGNSTYFYCAGVLMISDGFAKKCFAYAERARARRGSQPGRPPT